MKPLRIGTRDSQLAVWQATTVQDLLKKAGVASELVYIKSEGDVDTVTPLYALGVTGIFTKSLDAALLNQRIDIAVHSMKDVPTQMAQGIQQAAVLKRGSHKDILVLHPALAEREASVTRERDSSMTTGSGKRSSESNRSLPLRENPDKPNGLEDVVIATSSVRRIAQWLNKYRDHKIENIRGNVNTRLRKLKDSNWHGAIFAAAGLERIGLRPQNAVDLDWMLPAPAQGAIVVVCRKGDGYAFDSCQPFNDTKTALCTKIEKDFLRVLMGGCSTPVSALAETGRKYVRFSGNICAPDGSDLVSVGMMKEIPESAGMGEEAARQIMKDPRAQKIIETVRDGRG